MRPAYTMSSAVSLVYMDSGIDMHDIGMKNSARALCIGHVMA